MPEVHITPLDHRAMSASSAKGWNDLRPGPEVVRGGQTSENHALAACPVPLFVGRLSLPLGRLSSPSGRLSLPLGNTCLSSVLGNGDVEVLLSVLARDSARGVVNARPINGWKVNGQPQTKPDGTPADGQVIPVSLPHGTHRISPWAGARMASRFKPMRVFSWHENHEKITPCHQENGGQGGIRTLGTD